MVQDWSTYVHESGHAAACEYCGGIGSYILINRNGGGLFGWTSATDGRFDVDVAKAMICMAPEFVGTLMSPGDRAQLMELPLDAIREALNILSEESVQQAILVRASEIATLLVMGRNEPAKYLGTPDYARLGPIMMAAQRDANDRKKQYQEQLEINRQKRAKKYAKQAQAR